MGFISRSTGLFSRINLRSKGRPPFEGAYVYILAMMCGYFIADLSILSIRPAMLPAQPPPVGNPPPIRQNFANPAQYASIIDRNIFNSDGKIPNPKTAEGGEGDGGVDVAPVASSLPLSLEGTLVHANPARSVASIMLKGKNEVRAFSVDQDIDGMARVTSIERRKVIFRNLNNQRLEYIEIPTENSLTFGRQTAPVNSTDEVHKDGDNTFAMRRSDIQKYTADLGSILQQARVLPNIIPGSGGQIDGFRFMAIQPNSIYEKLGFKVGDVIKKVNNETVNNPTRAMELYNALKSEARITIEIERNGRAETFNYNVIE